MDKSFTKEQMLTVETFLHDILPNETEYNRLMEILHLGFKKRYSEKFNVFYGTGPNGKSVLVKLIRNTFSDAIEIPREYFTMNNNNEENEENNEEGRECNIDLSNCSFVCGFFEPGDELDCAKIKSFVGRDPITVRLDDSLESRKPSGELIFISNAIPTFDDLGMKSRMNLVQFNTKFVNTPTESNEKLRNPNIFNELVKCTNAFRHLVENYCVSK